MSGEQGDLFEGTVDAPAAPQGLTMEQEARNMGWRPQEEFHGPQDAWVDAEEFVERGKHILPILTQNNRRLQGELSVRDQKIAGLQSALTENQEAVKALQEHYKESTKRAVEQAKQEVISQLRAAKEAGNIDDELALTEQLQGLREAEKEVATATVPKKEPAAPPVELHPDVAAWQQQNSWFGVDNERTQNIIRISAALRAAGNTMAPKEFGDELLRIEKMQQQLSLGNGVSKVSGVSSGGTPAGSSSGKGFASLPADAKRECHSFASKVVGPNRVYKTLKDWETQYTKDYYGED